MIGLKAVGLSKMVGVNCTACHVGQIQYMGKNLRIDGAPNMFDIVGFLQEIKDTADATYTSPAKLWAYLKSRIKAGDASEEAKSLSTDKELDALQQGTTEDKAVAEDIYKIANDKDIDQAAEESLSNDVSKPEKVRLTFAGLAREYRLVKSYLTMLKNFDAAQNPATPPGFGRADAFGTARVLLFGKENMLPLSGPSSFPYIWNMRKTAWFHWPANTNSAVQRNIGQALGLGASFVPATGESTIDLYSLYRLEQLAYKTRPPAWPEDMFGKIDNVKADRGEMIYRGVGPYTETGNCAGCHEGGAKPYADDPSLVAYEIIPLHKVQTDPTEANDWAVPVKVPGNLLGERTALVTMDFGAAQAVFLDRIQRNGIARVKKERPDLKVDEIEWESGRKAKAAWRISYADPQTKEFGYPAKPLAGVWATAPYLHNGSVPTLADMLTPPEQRPSTFMVGTREYDPQKMGYRMDAADSTFRFDTSVKGNSNAGHPFGTKLTPEEKQDLMEFLKRLGRTSSS
jgi:cytochrome c peroxidase